MRSFKSSKKLKKKIKKKNQESRKIKNHEKINQRTKLGTKYFLYLNTKYFLQMYLNTKYIDVYKYVLNTFVNTFYVIFKISSLYIQSIINLKMNEILDIKLVQLHSMSIFSII